MRLEDAVKEGAQLAKGLSGRDAVVVHVLVQLAKRVIRSRRSIRALADALDPETALNQQSLHFGDSATLDP